MTPFDALRSSRSVRGTHQSSSAASGSEPAIWAPLAGLHLRQQRGTQLPRSAQVVAYGISINLVEVTWKGKIKAQFPNPNDYSAFMGDFSSSTGAVTFLMMIASRYIFRKFGWGVAAQITPIVLLITGAAPACT